MYLDIFLIAVMLISGLLAMVRGFMREILSIAGWVAAAGAAAFAFLRLVDPATRYFSGWNEIVVKILTVSVAFVITLIVVTILTTRLSDKILDSRIGALDRTLGFLFGLGRGFLIVAISFYFVNWAIKPESQPDFLRSARSRVVMLNTVDGLIALLPEDLDTRISSMFKKRPKTDEDAPEAPDQRSEGGIGGPRAR